MDYDFSWRRLLLSSRFIFLILIVVSSVSIVFGRPAGVQPILDFGEKVECARQELLDVYYDQVKQGLFSEASYVNSLVVDLDLENDAEQNALVLLRLINWLEQKNDRNSEFLLNKIGRLYFLELHQFLSSLDSHNPEVSSLIGHFHDLSMLQIQTATGAIYPFRTGIAKMSLSIFMINNSRLSYQQRKESVFYALEQVKKELLEINHKLGYRAVPDGSVQSLIYLMGRFCIQEPLIQKRVLGKVVAGVLALGLASGAIYWALHADWTHYGEKIRKEIVKPITSKLIVDIINGVLDDKTILSNKPANENQLEDGEEQEVIRQKTIREAIDTDLKQKIQEVENLSKEIKKTRESLEAKWAEMNGKNLVATGVKNTVIGVGKGFLWDLPKAGLWDSWHKNKNQDQQNVENQN